MLLAELLVHLKMCSLKILCIGGVIVVVAYEDQRIERCDVLDNRILPLAVAREAEVDMVNVKSSCNSRLIGVSGTGRASALSDRASVVENGLVVSVFCTLTNVCVFL